MNNREFLETYQLLQYSVVFNRLIDLNFTSISISDTLDSPYFNYAQTDMVLEHKEVLQVEEQFLSNNRRSTFYFENKPELVELLNLLEGKGYKKMWEDSWMFYKGKKPDEKTLSRAKKVESEEELEEYMHTFKESYQKDDPQNPYGELGGYLEHARGVWIKHRFTGKVEYCIVSDHTGHAVAVATLTNMGGVGYVSNVSSLMQVRGEDYGKIATMHCIKRSMERGNTIHCLTTEKGSYPYNFYLKNGFDVGFSAVGLVIS